ncbi:hypothetical protein [Nonomuraea sp. NPDC050691]|uniref:hypothetical protein n=1 Tax=Nonomuraea sp. NPDC050691 TaxID=3155661 RepID=UPI0033C7B8B0
MTMSPRVFWKTRWYVWNNSPGGDTADIYRGSDLKKIDTCSWRRGSDSTAC